MATSRCADGFNFWAVDDTGITLGKYRAEQDAPPSDRLAEPKDQHAEIQSRSFATLDELLSEDFPPDKRKEILDAVW